MCDVPARRIGQAISVLVVGLLVAGFGQALSVFPYQVAKEIHTTPDAAFRAFQLAEEKGDLEGMLKCSTDRWRDMVLGLWIIDAFVDRAFAMAMAAATEKSMEEVKARYKLIEDLLVQHGHKEKFFDRFADEDKGEKDGAKILMKIMAPIKNKGAFAKDLSAAWKKVDETRKGRRILREYKLTDVIITGDSARAVISRKSGMKLLESPIGFQKVDRGWKIDFVLEKPAKGSDLKEQSDDNATMVPYTNNWAGELGPREWRKALPKGTPINEKERSAIAIVANETDFLALWKALRPSDKAPKLDFQKQFVMAAIVDKDKQMVEIEHMDLNKNGNADILVKGITGDILGKGWYELAVFPRKGVKKVNGRALPE